MPTNKKPMLSILVDEEKRTQFAALCAKNSRPMAWAVNSFIDHCLEQNSLTLGTSKSIQEWGSMADTAGLAELREMIAELGQELKRMEASTFHIAIGEVDAVVEASHKPGESQPMGEEVCVTADDSQALRKQQFITEMSQKMKWKLRG
jgi:hemolysin-activating ACP:hemolysin acyltransferase